MLLASHALREKFTWERTLVLKEQKKKDKGPVIIYRPGSGGGGRILGGIT